MSIIDDKYIECYTVFTLKEGVINQTIVQAMENINVPEKYRKLVEIKVAERMAEKLPNTP